MVGEASKGFKFEPGGIGGIFKAHRLKVPTFQREYAWEKDQVELLLGDLNRAKDENIDHFLGTIVTVDEGNQKPLEIVDGQQRLTTTALLILAIRHAQEKLGADAKAIESINNDYLSTFDRRAGADVLRLVLNIDDNEFFAALIRGEDLTPSRESHRRLLAAYGETKSFVNRLAGGFREADRLAALNDWLYFIEYGATVILVRTDNAAKAFRMFETLNDRGLKTSQADLVKSYLFGESGSRIQEAQSRWSSMKDNLEEVADDDRTINFLRHFLITTRKFVRAEEVYTTVQSAIKGESNASAFLSSLEVYSRAYVATLQPSSEYWTGYSVTSTRALDVLNKFDLKPIRPLVLALAVKFVKNEFEKAIRLLAAASVRLVVASRTRSGTIETTFAAAALEVFSGTVTTTTQLKVSLKSVLVSDLDFENEFKQARVSKADYARYYLRSLESANSGESEPWYIENDDPSVITLEHVLPQNPESGWDHIPVETQKAYVKRLGNLCLVNKSGNEGLGNGPFASKKPTLSGAPYELTNMLGTYTNWSVTEIEDRQARLAKLALTAWPT